MSQTGATDHPEIEHSGAGQDEDEKRLAELGYSQALQRGWSSFSNFAISFTIISVLAGCFTTYYVGWNNGGPIAISWGWPIICGLILLVAVILAGVVKASGGLKDSTIAEAVIDKLKGAIDSVGEGD